MHARHTTLQLSAAKIDDAVRQLEQEQLPKFREQDGYKGFTVLADRATGMVVGITFWESEEALRASEELASQARGQASETGEAGGEPDVAQLEVLIDDMV